MVVVDTKGDQMEAIMDTRLVPSDLSQVMVTKVVDSLHHEMTTMADMQSDRDLMTDLVHKGAAHNFLIVIIVVVMEVVLLVDHHVVEIMMHNFQRYLKF